MIYVNYEKYIFIYDFAVIVLWGFEEDEEKLINDLFCKNCKSKMKTSSSPYIFFLVKKGEIFEVSFQLS